LATAQSRPLPEPPIEVRPIATIASCITSPDRLAGEKGVNSRHARVIIALDRTALAAGRASIFLAGV
jgi:hypothetical protein